MIRFLEPYLAEKDKHYWILNNGYIVQVPYNSHTQFCIDNECELDEVENECIRIHQPIGETRLVASAKRQKYSREQIKTLSIMDWVIIDPTKL